MYDFHGYPQKIMIILIIGKHLHLQIKNKIEKIFVLNPLMEKKPLENILNNCFDKEVLTDVLYQLNLKNC